jgi:hypothetical protein
MIKIDGMQIDFKPENYKTAAGAAKALYSKLAKLAVDIGQRESEVMLMNPERTEQYSGYRQWAVVWEAGPYQWAIPASMEIGGRFGYTEPYYSFDLHFVN